MTSKKNTRRALFMSALSLILCFAMLMGTTFAWFTDSVTSGNNIIEAGNLDIELYHKDTNEASYAAVGSESLFEDVLWEPGHVEVENLKIENLGTLNLKYQFNVSVVTETGSINKAGEAFKLSDHIKFAIIDGAFAGSREAAVAAAEAKGPVAVNGLNWTIPGTMAPKATKEVTLVVWMPESVGNEANYKTGEKAPEITLGVNLYATQQTAESDSFDDQYDKGTWHPDFTVTSVEDLAAALAIGGKIQVNGTLNAGATQDVPNWTNAPAEFIFDATTLDALKGGKYVLEQGSRYGVVGLISAGESLALSDMEITANSQWPVYLSNYGGTLTLEDIDVTATQGAGIYPYGTNGTTTIKSATVNQKALSDEFASSTPWAGTAIATSNGHNLIIEDGTYIGSTWGVYVYNSGANVTINGGTFKAPKVIQADGVWSTGGNKSVVTVNDGNFDGALYLDWGTTPPEIYINGGNFTNFSATVNGAAKLVIKGGTFDADPSAYVAAGYKVTDNGDGTYTVQMTNDAADDLFANVTDGGTVTLGAGNFTIPSNDVAGKDITIEGQGKNTVLDFTVANNVGDADITFKNLHIQGKNENVMSGFGIQHTSGDIVYENCTFDGAVTNEYSGTVTYKNCTFTGTGYITTYAVKSATFVDCTFNKADSRAVLVYSHGDNPCAVTLNGCKFMAGAKGYTGAGDWTAAVEIDTTNIPSSGTSVTITGCTADGNYSGIVRDKSAADKANAVITVDGKTYAFQAAQLAKALTADASSIDVVLGKAIDCPISSLGQQTGGSGEYKLGGVNTNNINIDLNNKKLNVTTTYWSGIGAKNDNATITIKNGTMTSSQATGTWNSYDVTFANCNYVIEDVTFDKAIAFTNANKSVKLSDVTINETHDYYAMWITAEGQNVAIDGLTVNSAGRGIKIDEQYVGTPAKVTLNVSNSAFNTAKKAAILVKSVAGADITLNNVNISNVAADKTNTVWVDSDAAAYADKVTVTGGSVITEA